MKKSLNENKTNGQVPRVEPSSGDPDRIQSGIPRLDSISKGGFLRGGTYVIYGPPGSGKTILGNQTCFNIIQQNGDRCLYITLLTESLGKMMRHLQPLMFFDEAVVSNQKIYYLNGFQTLRKDGTKGLLKMIRHALKTQNAKTLTIDGIECIMRLYPSEQSFVEFIYELMAMTQLNDCTTFLHSGEGRKNHPENGVVDGVIELSLSLIGPRAIRELTVHKFRGSDFLPGKHEVEITERGIQIHPRTEIQFDKPKGMAQETRIRMALGVKALDAMMHGGVLSGSTTALLGAPGTGKTFLGLSFLIEGAKQGHQGIYYGFYEPPPRLIEKAEKIGLPLRKFVESGKIKLVWQPPLEHYLDSLAEDLLESIKEKYKNEHCRLFIDGVEGFRSANPYPERMGRFLSAFTNQLRTHDVTTLITEELGLFRPEIDMPNPELGHVVETIVVLRLLELKSQVYRLVSILKMRESLYDTSIREFKITPKGLSVENSFKSAESLLTGHGRVTRNRLKPKKAFSVKRKKP